LQADPPDPHEPADPPDPPHPTTSELPVIVTTGNKRL
jgi:hypothetical protein